MEVVIPLEDAVVLHDPVCLVIDIRCEQRRCSVAVVLGSEGIGDIVQQGANDQVNPLTIAERPGSGLQRMVVAVDLISKRWALEHAEHGRQVDDECTAGMFFKLRREHLVIGLVTVLH